MHIARLEAARKFPLHIDLGENSIAWFEDEIDDLLEMKAAERDAKARRSPIRGTAPTRLTVIEAVFRFAASTAKKTGELKRCPP